MKIELKGWKAIAALVIIGAAIVWKFAAERSTLASEAADELKFWLLLPHVPQYRDWLAGQVRGHSFVVLPQAVLGLQAWPGNMGSRIALAAAPDAN